MYTCKSVDESGQGSSLYAMRCVSQENTQSCASLSPLHYLAVRLQAPAAGANVTTSHSWLLLMETFSGHSATSTAHPW